MFPKPANPCANCTYYSVTHHLKHRPYFNTITGFGFCQAEGTSRSGVAFVGEGSGEWEEASGYPLRANAQAGSMHTRILRSLYRSRKDTFATNIIACRPPDNEDPRQEAIVQCRPLLKARLDKWKEDATSNPHVKQPIIVALGDIAWTELTGKEGNSVNKRSISYARGYPEWTPYGLVIGTFHPAFVRRNTKLMGVLVEDYRTAFDIAESGWNPMHVNYITSPTEWEIRDFRDRILAVDPNNPDFRLIFDYETPDVEPEKFPERIISVQFATKPGEAIFMYINSDTLPVIQAIMAHPVRKAGHNTWDFDVPLSFHHGIPIGGIVDDTLLGWKHLQPDLTIEEQGSEAGSDWRYSTAAGLQYVASFFGADGLWKHKRLSRDVRIQEEYACEDVDNNARIVYGVTHRKREGLFKQLRDRGIWNGYERYVREFYPVLQKAAARGIPIDRGGQLKFAQDLTTVQAEIDTRIQVIHPDALKRTEPKAGYVKDPKPSAKIRWVWEPAADATVAGQVGRGPEWDFNDPTQPWLQYIGNPAYGVYQWFDEGEDVATELTEEDREDGVEPITGVWRPMIRRTYADQEIKETRECACLAAPVKGRGRKQFAGRVPASDCTQCSGKGIIHVTRRGAVSRWARLVPFSPSKQQITIYAAAKKHKLPKIKGKTTTAAKGLDELAKATEDPLYQAILDQRTVGKMKSTYVTGKGWMKRRWEKRVTQKDGREDKIRWVETTLLPMDQQPPRIHTTFTLGPATGQTSSRRPNVQNVPKHTRNQNLKALNVPKRFRALIKARPGFRIWDFDLKSAHALTLGLEAKSEKYMRLARLDLHSYFTSILAIKRGLWSKPIDLKVSDADLKLALDEVRYYVHPSGVRFEADIRDVQAKPAGLGIGFGMMGHKLWETNKDAFKDEYDAQEVINDYYLEFKEILAYHNAVVAEAHDRKHLVSRGGFIRWFWHVHDFRYDPVTEKPMTSGHGEDTEDAKAFRPANTAFVYMRDAEIRLENMGVNDEANFINVVHDSNMFEILRRMEHDFGPETAIQLGTGYVQACVPSGHRNEDELVAIIKAEMERPQPLLGDPVLCPEGLTIACDVAAGEDWAHMEKIKL